MNNHKLRFTWSLLCCKVDDGIKYLNISDCSQFKTIDQVIPHQIPHKKKEFKNAEYVFTIFSLTKQLNKSLNFNMLVFIQIFDSYQAKKSLPFLVYTRIASDPHINIFNFLFVFAMKWCPIAAKIAGLIGILPCCVLNNFFPIGVWTFCLICEASLSHHTLYMGKIGPHIHVSRISLLAKKKDYPQKKHYHIDFEANWWLETGDFFCWPKVKLTF